METLVPGNERKIKRLTRVLNALIVIAVLVLAVVSYSLFIEQGQMNDDLFNPLGDYPVQIVTAEHFTEDGGKAIFLGQDVEVEGIKCNDSSSAVAVEGTITWQAIDPRGPVVQTGQGSNEHAPGCTTTVFQNQIPSEVQLAVESQHRNGIVAPVWRISGVEFPIDDEGARGVPKRFVTENFVILPTGFVGVD